LPGSWRKAWSAAPIGPTEGVLVVVHMQGGNDGFDTLVPTGNSIYAANRGAMAISSAAALDIGGGFGLHPNLTYLKRRWDAGQLAVVQGVGYPGYDLSHFSSAALWMQGQATAGPPDTGWLGRWLDGHGASPDAFHAITIGSSVPLHLIGASRRATGLGEYPSEFGVSTSAIDIAMFNALRNMAGGASPSGPWADAIAAMGRQMVDVNVAAAPAYLGPQASTSIGRQLRIAARLVNADLGIRVVNVSADGYDTHANQPTLHGDLMRELDDALNDFYALITPRFSGRVAVMTFSEFGRQLPKNDSNGTDHGTASVMMLLGDRVRGGLHGTAPDLGHFVGWEQIGYTTDFRSVYAAVLDRWLGADSAAVLGAHYDAPNLFAATPGIAPMANAPTGGGGALVPIVPSRSLDTRDGTGGAPTGLDGASVFELKVTGRNGVPPNGVDAVIMNVTVTEPTTGGYLTIWPAGETRPSSSSLNFSAGVTVPNLVIAKVGTGGRVAFFNSSGHSHVIADVVGYTAHADNAGFVGLVPARVLDTRSAGGPIGPGQTRRLPLVGVAGVPSEGASAVVLNVTVTEPSAGGYVTVWPTTDARPNASNLNFGPGQTVPNLVVCKLGTDGSVSLFNAAGSSHVIADVVGYFTPWAGGVCASLTPVRVLDTRDRHAPLTAGATIDLTVAGTGGVPATGATAVALNVTVTEPTANGYLTVWPAGTARPVASNLNFVPGQTVPNLVMCKLGANGAVSIYNATGSSHVIADVVAWFA
jgi:uncharacterized protein (DUF1501 family)